MSCLKPVLLWWELKLHSLKKACLLEILQFLEYCFIFIQIVCLTNQAIFGWPIPFLIFSSSGAITILVLPIVLTRDIIPVFFEPISSNYILFSIQDKAVSTNGPCSLIKGYCCDNLFASLTVNTSVMNRFKIIRAEGLTRIWNLRIKKLH